VYVEHRFDWNGAILKKIRDFGKSGILRPLVTDITKREVNSNLFEHATEARNRLQKFRPTLKQLGIPDMIDDVSAAHAVLCNQFDEYLANSKITEISVPSDSIKILEDYFAGRPPFGAGKKKAEFPDAFVVAGIREWCKTTRNSVYIISRDSDLAACCDANGPLIHLQTVQQLLSLAVVNHDTRTKLLKAVMASKELPEKIRSAVEDMHMSCTTGRDVEIENVSVDGVNIIGANVIDSDKHSFLLEVEAEVEISGEVRSSTFEHTMIQHDPSVRPRISYVGFSSVQYVYPQIEMTFDPSDPNSLSIVDIGLHSHEFEIELDRHSRMSDSIPRQIRLRVH
jgi:hypothetical protein